VDKYLKAEMSARGWNVSKLAEACNVSIGLAAKWVTDNPRYHVQPGPTSCAKIAAGLGVDADYVLELAGHRAPRPAADWAHARVTAWRQSIHEQLEAWISAVGPQYEEFFWRYLKSQGDSTVAMLRDLGIAVNPPSGGAIKRAVKPAGKPTSTRRRRGGGALRASYRTASAALAARYGSLNVFAAA
jgi:transcriptional regulator with XRE-family HTH domain